MVIVSKLVRPASDRATLSHEPLFTRPHYITTTSHLFFFLVSHTRALPCSLVHDRCDNSHTCLLYHEMCCVQCHMHERRELYMHELRDMLVYAHTHNTNTLHTKSTRLQYKTHPSNVILYVLIYVLHLCLFVCVIIYACLLLVLIYLLFLICKHF